MCPQARLLVMQPQVRLAHSVSTHLLTSLLVLAILICDSTVGNRMHNMNTLLAQLSCERLCQLSNRRTPSTVCRELRAASQCTERTSEDESLEKH